MGCAGRALVPAPPTERTGGGFIAEGYDAALDELRSMASHSRRAIAALEAKYRDETGVAALKIRHNGVLGYFIEVPAARAEPLMAADSGFTHRQTMAGAVRFKPILLTALAAMIGAATILVDPIFQGLAISLLFGLASSTALTVLVIPAIYVVMRGGPKFDES